MLIRKARAEDVDDFIRIKNQLPLKYTDEKVSKSGFLLGTNEATYLKYIENDYCLVAENEAGIIGFGIVLKNDSVKKSDIWIRRHQANWTINIQDYELQKICYFEQLAFLHGHSRTVMKLAYNVACWAFKEKHTALFTTTVKYPITNLAAVPYIMKSGGQKIGNIDETYPIIGQINSDIYKIGVKAFHESIASSKLGSFLENSYVEF